MAYTNIKTEIDGKIYTNILREITGDILNEVLKKMVDSLGKGYRYMGILEPDDSRPSGDENMFMIATEAGYYPAVSDDIPSGITICTFAEGVVGKETILNLDDLFSSNHSWGGSNTFNGFTRFGDEVDVYFNSLYDLEDGETLSGKLASLVTAIATKISKVTGAVEDNLATFDENGSVKDSGVSVDDLAKNEGISEKLVSGSARGILSPSAIEELFLFQRTANGAGGTGAAIFQSIKGNSIVWNQLVPSDNINFTNTSTDTRTSLQLQVQWRSGESFIDAESVASTAGLQSVILTAPALATGLRFKHNGQAKDIDIFSSLLPVTGGHKFFISYNIKGTDPTTAGGMVIEGNNVYDLTQYGVPDLTAAQFRALYPGVFAPNPGTIKNNCATGMVTDGFNQWDEVWEVGGYNASTGVKDSAIDRIRSKNFIQCLPSTTYYVLVQDTSQSSKAVWIRYYDAEHQYIGTSDALSHGTFTTPANCCYITFNTNSTYGTTYKNDICINLSGSRNGQYEPHWSDTCALPITTATGKLNGEGESVVISPNGLAGVGSSFDEAIVEKGMWTKTKKRRMQVDMGTLAVEYQTGTGDAYPRFRLTLSDMGGARSILCEKYPAVSYDTFIGAGADKTICSLVAAGYVYVKDSSYTDAATFKAAMDGVMLDYELATEQLYVLDTPVPVVARVDENGTQTILPQGVDLSGVPMTAPFKASIQYPVKLGVAPIGQQSLVNLLERMKSAGKIASYTMVWDATTGVYDFTIS